MVTKHYICGQKDKDSSVLAKILMVTKRFSIMDMVDTGSVLAKILMVTKPNAK